MIDHSSKIRELLCPKDRWISDKSVSKCKACERSFIPLLVWRHHCRFCGCVFCSDCAGNILTGESIGYQGEKRLRHCNNCRMRIETVINQDQNNFRKHSDDFDVDRNFSMLQIEDPDLRSAYSQDQRKTVESIKQQSVHHRFSLQTLAISLLRQLAKQLCEHYGLETATWEIRLAEISWRAVTETNPQIFIRKEPFNLHHQIKVITIIAPTEAVAAACVKGLVLQKNIPSKHLQTHLKYPRVVTVRTPIEADTLMQSKQLRFDEMVVNQQKILKNYLEPLFHLNPNVVFVQENISKRAMQLALQKNVMLVPKVKSEDLSQIQRLALIKKRVDNLLYIEKDQIADIIGCCQRIYFKTVKQGQMLLFVEHEAGVRTVLLGDASEASNKNLKNIFLVLLRAAWNLKNQREVAIRDSKLCPDAIYQSKIIVAKSFDYEKYISFDNFLRTQTVNLFKMTFCQAKFEDLSKPFQEYCKLRGKKRMLDPCGDVLWLTSHFYLGEDISLGSFVLKCAIQSLAGCLRCEGQHLYRFFIDQYCVSVSTESYLSNNATRLSAHIQEFDDDDKNYIHDQHDKENHVLHSQILKFIHVWKMQQNEQHPKLLFNMYFKCQDCSKIMGNSKCRVGNDFLLINFYHFLHTLIHAVRINEKRLQNSDDSVHNSTNDLNCQHNSVVRIFQCPRALVKFHIAKIEKYNLLPIILSDEMMKKIIKKDYSMVTELFNKMLEEINGFISSLEGEMDMLPFSGGMKGVAASLSIAGTSALQHMYFWPFMKIAEAMAEIRNNIIQIQQNKEKYIEQGSNDWTILMRKFAKIEHVLKASSQVIAFIVNALKKQKIQEFTQEFPSSIQQGFDLQHFTSQQKSYTPLSRKFSEQPVEDLFLTKSQSVAPSSATSFASFRVLKKHTSFYLQTQLQHLQRRMRKQRYLKYQGAYLYFPIGNIDDAVSLLSCCLNSDEFKEQLKQNKYKENINIRLKFARELKTTEKPTPIVLQVYKDLIKDEFYKNQFQEIEFSVYYHKEFEELRTSENIDFRLYVRSLYGCQKWDSSGGKSSSTFSKAHNQTLVVKIINQKEFVQFQKFASAYLQYMKNKREKKEISYLAKIFGIYEVEIKSKVYKCVVMQNIFFGLDTITRVYDLKGSEVNRLAQPLSEKAFTGLDTNFLIDRDSYPYLLDSNVYDKTIQSLTDDANFLKQQGVIDYSLLVIQSEQSLRMGIIDFMRPYHFVQKIQSIYKEIKSGKDPTVIPPQQYAERFVRAVRRYFAKSQSLQLFLDK